MNPKNTFLLVLLAGGLFAFIFFFERRIPHLPPPPAHVVPDLKPEEVKDVLVHLAGQSEIRVERTNGGWRITKPLVYPARAEAVESLLKAAAELELTSQTYISAAELKGRLTMNTEYGFDNPQATITFGLHPELVLGFFTAPGDQIYAQLVGLEGVDILDADFFKKLVPHNVNDWRDLAFTHFNPQDFDKLTVAAGSQTFTLQRDGSNTVWRMIMPVRTRADYPKIDGLLLQLQKLEVARFVTDEERADLESFGLQPPALELSFDRGTNRLFTLQFGKSPTNDSVNIYARYGGQNSIVLLPRGPVAAWLGGFQAFRDHRLMRLADGPPDLIEIYGPENITLQQQTNDLWRMTSPENFVVDTNAMNTFLLELAGLEVTPVNGEVAVKDSVLPDVDLPGYGLAPPMRRYVLKHDAAHLPLGATNPVLAELDLGLEKEGKVFARRADHPEETSVYAVRAGDVQELPFTVMQFRPRRIWDFTQDQVVRIIIHQDGHARELVHLAPNRWGIVSGSGMINELQVEVAAQELGFLEASDWVKRGDADRARLGFTDKSLQLDVQVKQNGPPQTLTLWIAEKSPRGVSPRGLRYGDVKMADGENWIFEIPTTALEQVTSFLNIRESAVP